VKLDENTLISCKDKSIKLWNIIKSKLILTLQDHVGAIYCLKLLNDTKKY
jgi:WD40 repeat protein